jgi:hypothetical protein
MINRLSVPLRNTLSGPSLHIELQIAVNAIYPLVIKAMTIKLDTVKTLPKVPACSTIDDLLKRINNRLIPLKPVLLWPIKRRPRQTYDPAGLAFDSGWSIFYFSSALYFAAGVIIFGRGHL